MEIDRERILSLVKNLEFEEAISHRVRSRIFEMLGYLSIIDRENLPGDVRTSLESLEELNKTLIEEIHLIIEYFTEENIQKVKLKN